MFPSFTTTFPGTVLVARSPSPRRMLRKISIDPSIQRCRDGSPMNTGIINVAGAAGASSKQQSHECCAVVLLPTAGALRSLVHYAR